jgi:bacteriocin-like protein
MKDEIRKPEITNPNELSDQELSQVSGGSPLSLIKNLLTKLTDDGNGTKQTESNISKMLDELSEEQSRI